MSLSDFGSQILECKISILEDGSYVTGFPLDLDIQSEEINIFPVFWDSVKDVALSGKKRSNIRDYDLQLTLDYNTSLEPDKIETIFDALVDLSSNTFEMRFFPDASNGDFINMIPSDGTRLLLKYEDTVRVGGSKGVIPTMVFEADEYKSNIEDFFTDINTIITP